MLKLANGAYLIGYLNLTKGSNIGIHSENRLDWSTVAASPFERSASWKARSLGWVVAAVSGVWDVMCGWCGIWQGVLAQEAKT